DSVARGCSERVGMNGFLTFIRLVGPQEEFSSKARLRRRLPLALAVCFIAVIAVACTSSKASPGAAPSAHTSSTPATPPSVTITVKPAGFDPPTVTTAVEGNVIWYQGDAKAHVITSGVPGKPDGKFESLPLAQGS